MKNFPLLYLLMTALSLTSTLTFGQSSQDIEQMQPVGLNKVRIMSILPRESFDYLFPVRHESVGYNQFIDILAQDPQFCRSLATSEFSNSYCRAQLALIFAYMAKHTSAFNPYLGVEMWRQGLYLPLADLQPTLASFDQTFAFCDVELEYSSKSNGFYPLYLAYFDLSLSEQKVGQFCRHGAQGLMAQNR